MSVCDVCALKNLQFDSRSLCALSESFEELLSKDCDAFGDPPLSLKEPSWAASISSGGAPSVEHSLIGTTVEEANPKSLKRDPRGFEDMWSNDKINKLNYLIQIQITYHESTQQLKKQTKDKVFSVSTPAG